MNAETTVQSAGDMDDPEVAFEAMSRRLAGLTAAVEGFAARQQELHARDYGADLAKIHALSGKIIDAINKLAAKPGVALTPEALAPQISKAGERVRAADHQAWSNANRELGAAIQSLNGVVASALKADTQRLWIIGATTAALVVGFAFGTVVPTRIAQSVPESWHWPEQRAADVLLRGEWDAGMRLLQVADPARLRALNEAALLVKDNAEELADCRSRAVKSQETVRCRIEVAALKAM
jgi:predicted peptidase